MTSKKFLDLTGLAHFKNKVQAEIDEKPTLPTTVNDKYLHTNASTGEYEWVDVTSGGGTVKKVKVNGTEQGPDASGTVDIGTVITAHQDISGKQDKSSLESDVAAKGFTKNAGTITSVKMNGTVVSASGEADLGTVITSHQDISGKENKADLDQDVKDLGYTKNTGTVTGVKVNGTVITDVGGTVDIGTVITEHQDITGKQDKSTLDADVGTCGYTKNSGTITEVKMNGASKGTSGVIDLGDVVTDVSSKLDVLGKEVGSQEPYKLPYFFSKTADASKITVTAHTITMDNAKSLGTYTMDIPSATTANAGLMASADKSALDAILIKDASVSSGTLTITKKDGTPVTFTKTAVADSLVSTSVTEALSANKGKELNDRIDNVSSMGRFLSVWNCATGVPVDKPGTIPYTYKSGDYYIVGSITTGTNYRPKGAQFTDVVSQDSEAEPDSVHVNDIYRYTTSGWVLQSQEEKEVTFSSVTGNPRDNSLLATELDKAVPKLGTEPGSGEQYHFPYNFNSIVQNADNISTTFDTVTLDGNKTKASYNLAIPSADIANNKAGLYNKTLAAAKADVTALNTEATERQTADANLQTAITNEKTRAEGAESTLTTNLATEVTARETLATTVTSNTGRIAANETAITALQTGLSTETTNRTAKDTELQTAIDGKLDKQLNAPDGGAYRLPYFFRTVPSASQIVVEAETITLDNNQTYQKYTLPVVGASSTLAGLMTAADKTKLNALNVKDASVSGTTLTLTRETGGDITFTGGPSAFIKSATVSLNTLTLKDQSDTTITFSPSAEPSAYLKSASVSGQTLTLTNKDDTTVTFTADPTSVISDSTTSATDKTYSINKIKEMIENLGGTFKGEFATKALLDATTGVKNDYAVVTADETHSGSTTMYYHNGTAWAFAYVISTAALQFRTINGENIVGSTSDIQIINDSATASTENRTYSVKKINELTTTKDIRTNLLLDTSTWQVSGNIPTSSLTNLMNGDGTLIVDIQVDAGGTPTTVGHSRVHITYVNMGGTNPIFNGIAWLDVSATGDNFQPMNIYIASNGTITGGLSMSSSAYVAYSDSITYDNGTVGRGIKDAATGLKTHTDDDTIHVTLADKSTWTDKSKVTVPAAGTSSTPLEYINIDGTEYKIPQGTWGSIGGTLANQTDLNTALNAKAAATDLQTHTENEGIHVVETDKTKWDTTSTNFGTHSADTTIHITATERSGWNTTTSNLTTHTGNGNIHVTASDKTAWNAKLGAGDVINLLTSTDVNKPLSANMGKSLKDALDALTARVAAIEADCLKAVSP